MFALLHADLMNFDRHLKRNLRRKLKIVFGSA
jgi:hypothetical protein